MLCALQAQKTNSTAANKVCGINKPALCKLLRGFAMNNESRMETEHNLCSNLLNLYGIAAPQ